MPAVPESANGTHTLMVPVYSLSGCCRPRFSIHLARVHDVMVGSFLPVETTHGVEDCPKRITEPLTGRLRLSNVHVLYWKIGYGATSHSRTMSYRKYRAWHTSAC